MSLPNGEQPVGELEPIASRWNRDWLQVRDDRRVRGIDQQHVERTDRRYVDPRTAVSEVTGNTPPQGPDPAPVGAN